MSTITAVHEEDFDAEVEAGVTRLTLNSYLRDTGLWFPIGQYVYPVLWKEGNVLFNDILNTFYLRLYGI